jgi:hypothetical protein
MKFGNEFWLILFREHISQKLFAVGGKGGAQHELIGNNYVRMYIVAYSLAPNNLKF